MNSPRILILAASTILLFILVFTRLDVALTAEILSQSNMAYIFLAILVNMAAYIMASLRFMLLLESKTRLLKMVPISFMSLFISTLTPFGVGEASKIIYLEKLERIKKSDSLSAFIIEKVFGFAVLLILGLIFSVILFNFSIAYFAFVTLVMIFFLFVLGKRTRVNVIVFRFIKILSKKLHSKAVVFEKEHYNKINRLGSKRIFYFISVTLSIYLVEIVSVFLLLKSINLEVAWYVSFIIYFLPVLLGLISTSPGGFGVRELSMIVLLESFLISSTEAIVITTLFTFIAVIIPSLIGFVFHLVLIRKT